METNSSFYGTEKINKIFFKIAPPVMLAQLIQALYNIVDSLFVGKYSESGLTALSIIYPVQLLMIALAVGTGVGINTNIAHFLGIKRYKKADEVAGIGFSLAIIMWILFAVSCYLLMPAYARLQTNSDTVIADVITYGRIVCVGSIGLFTESIWTKVLQANGDMKTPMIAQIAGAITNIVLDPILIFGLFGIPKLGIAGAAFATITGQVVAALLVMKKGFRRSPSICKYPEDIRRIYALGIPNIIMQATYTFYIFGLNMILAGFSDEAVTALGLYYKWQTFFFIPLGALQTCIVPIISYNYAAKSIDRCKHTMTVAFIWGIALMFIGTLCFEFIPDPMLSVFTKDSEVIRIGVQGFRFIGISFIPMVGAQIYPVFLQATGEAFKSSFLTILRTVFLFVPLGYLFSRFGFVYFWLTFPVTEVITTIVGFLFYRSFYRQHKMIVHE